jgi:hypothetical protein
MDKNFQLLANTKSVLAALYGKNIFSFVNICHTVFQHSGAILHSNLQRMRVPVALHPLPVFGVLSVLDF